MKLIVDTQGFDEATRMLGAFGKKGTQVVKRSLNRGARGVSVDASREVRRVYPIRISAIRSTFRFYPATSTSLTAKALSTGKRISLRHFGARPKTVEQDRRRRKGVSVQLRKGQRTTFRHAFLASLIGGNLHVVQRKGKARLPILRMHGPSVPQMIGQPEIVQRIEKGIQHRVLTNLHQGLNFLIRRHSL